MAVIKITQHFDAAPEKVFAFLGKHTNLSKVFAPAQVVRTRDAADASQPDGLGSVRRIGWGPIKPIQEEITAFEPSQRVEYRIIGRSPIKNHRGEMRFSPANGGTRLDYTIELDSDIPLLATVVSNGLELVIRNGLKKLASQPSLMA